MRNLDAIVDNENQVNRILDGITLMAETSQIGSIEERQMFESRIKNSFATIFDLNEQIEKYMPMVLSELKNHIKETETKKTHWFCFKKVHSRSFTSEMFKITKHQPPPPINGNN